MMLLLEAESLILHQFSRSPRLKGLVRCLVKPFQEALDEIGKLHHGNYLKQAYGQTLDVIGSIVGQARLEMSDEDYQPWIKVGIKLNTSAEGSSQIHVKMQHKHEKVRNTQQCH